MQRKLIVSGVLAACSCSLVVTRADDIIYDARPDPFASSRLLWVNNDLGETGSANERPGGGENESAVADRVTLAGTSRFVTRVETVVSTFAGGNWSSLDVVMTAYADAGGLPGDVLWSGATRGVTPTLFNNRRTADVAFEPNIVFPDNVIVGFALENIVGQAQSALGIDFRRGIPTVGQSDPTVLYQDSTSQGWSIYADPIPNGPWNMGLVISAVPATSSLVMLPAAGLLLAVRRRR